MEYIIDYVKKFDYKKIVFYIILLSVYALGFIYLNNKINKKEVTKIESVVMKEEQIENKEQEKDEKDKIQEYIYVDIKGAVKKPGVYKLNIDSRVIDAINISGGLVKNSNTDYINLSKILKDSEIIKVYTNEEIKKLENDSPQELPKIETNIKEENQNEIKLININEATKEQLKELNGIGDSKAESIIEYRNNIGKFNSIDEIKNIDGISETIFNKIKEFITI